MNYHCPRPPKQRAFDTSLLMWRRRFLSGTAFSPASLFASGEDGGWYDPSDLTSMFVGRDGSGGNPSAGSNVGVVLDKSQMGGQTAASFIAGQPESLPNGDFTDGNITGWTDASSPPANIQYSSVDGGSLFLNANGNTSRARISLTTVVGRFYRLTFVSGSSSTAAATLDVGTTAGANDILSNIAVPVGTETAVVFKATSTTTWINFYRGATQSIYITNVSVKEIPGNHLVAPSDAARPLLQTEGGRYYLDFDGTDDRMDFTEITGATGTEFETVFGVSYNDVTPNSDEVLGSSGSSKIGQGNGAVFVRIEGTGTAITTGATADGVKYVQGAYTNGTTEVSRLNGSDTATRAVPGATWAFSRVGVGDGVNYFLGRIYGITIIDRALTTEERDNLEIYLANKSGATLA